MVDYGDSGAWVSTHLNGRIKYEFHREGNVETIKARTIFQVISNTAGSWR